MLIQSNILEVIANLEQLKSEIPKVLNQVIVSPKLLELLRQSARSVLQFKISGLRPERQQIIQRMTERLVDSIAGTEIAGGMLYSATLEQAAGEGAPNLASAIAAADAAMTPSGRIKKSAKEFDASGFQIGTVLDSDENYQQVREAILQWVLHEKEIKDAPGERDYGKTPEEIAADLMFILGLNRRSELQGDSAVRQEAAEKIAHHIQDFMERDAAGEVLRAPDDPSPLNQTIPIETILEWLDAILKIWIVEVKIYLENELKIELAKISGRFRT